jgi:cytochrome c
MHRVPKRRCKVKRTTIILLMVVMAGFLTLREGASEEDEEGASLFKERGCGACHDRTKDQSVLGLGPSMEQVAEAYEGHEDEMVKFLRGGCDPIIDEARFPIMHGEIVKMKGLSDAEIRALQKYICGQKGSP